MKLKKILFLFFILTILSFDSFDKQNFEFIYPKLKEAKISFLADHFKKFKKEWRGSDYYYYSENDGFICSVLFYKLTEEEKLTLINVPKAAFAESFKEAGKDFPKDTPMFAYSYFKNYSNLRKMEKNDQTWGEPTDDFMFRENIITIEGTQITQNHMYGYAMFGDDLFVNVHLSKMNCNEKDISEMKEILNSLKKEK